MCYLFDCMARFGKGAILRPYLPDNFINDTLIPMVINAFYQLLNNITRSLGRVYLRKPRISVFQYQRSLF